MLLCSPKKFEIRDTIVYVSKENIFYNIFMHLQTFCYISLLVHTISYSNFIANFVNYFSTICINISSNLVIYSNVMLIDRSPDKNWVELTDPSSCDNFNISWASIADLLNLKPNFIRICCFSFHPFYEWHRLTIYVLNKKFIKQSEMNFTDQLKLVSSVTCVTVGSFPTNVEIMSTNRIRNKKRRHGVRKFLDVSFFTIINFFFTFFPMHISL